MWMSRKERDRRVNRIEEILGYRFEDRSLIEAAITHPSALEDNDCESDSYERLEFLGDSIVGAVIAAEVYRRYPKMDEGGMTRIKVTLVSGATLSKAAEELGIADCIIFGGSEAGTGRRGLHSALENVFESITGALFLDGGMEVAADWVLEQLGDLIDEDMALVPENPKSTLQEYLQVRRITPTYATIGEDGPPHDRVFTACAYSDGTPIGQGTGRSKKEAEMAAALDAIKKLGIE